MDHQDPRDVELPDRLLSHHPPSSRPRLYRLLVAVMSQTAALPSDVPLELSKLRVEHTPCTAGRSSGRLTAPTACTPLGGCDDEHAQAHSRVRI
jgi:hypothetical protein